MYLFIVKNNLIDLKFDQDVKILRTFECFHEPDHLPAFFWDNGNKILPKTLLNFTYTKSVCHITIVHRNMVKIVNTRQKKLTWAMHGPRWPSKAPVCPMEGTNRVVGPWRHPRTMEIHRMTSRAIGNHAWPRLVFVSMVFYM